MSGAQHSADMRLGASRPCRRCATGIVAYYPQADGHLVALDVTEDAQGSWVLEIDLEDTSRTFARQLRAGEQTTGRRFTSHADTCKGVER